MALKAVIVDIGPDTPLVLGPTVGGSTNNAIVRWDGTTGLLVKNSSAFLDDAGNISATSFSGDLDASDLTTGTVGTARLGSGTANSTTFLRGDGTWAVPAGGGGGSVEEFFFTDNDGVEGVVTDSTTTPTLEITLTDIIPDTVNGLTITTTTGGVLTIANTKTLTVSDTADVSGTNTGDQTTSGTSNRITVSSGTTNPVIDIAATYVGQASITTLGTISTGTWNATTIAVARGGTGATDAAGARTNLDAQQASTVLTALASVSPAADKFPYFTGVSTADVATVTSAARTVLDDASTSDMRTTLGVAIGSNVQAYSAVLDAVAGGTYSGDDSITTVGTIGTGTWAGTTIAVNRGGTGQTSYTDGQLLIGNTSGNTLTKATLTAGTGISIDNGNGSITINATAGGVGGPVSSTDKGIATWNGTGGNTLQDNSAATITSGVITANAFIPTSSTATGNRFYLANTNTPAISANGAKVIEFGVSGTAVNYFKATAGATGISPYFEALSGTDADVGFQFFPKGQGQFYIRGNDASFGISRYNTGAFGATIFLYHADTDTVGGHVATTGQAGAIIASVDNGTDGNDGLAWIEFSTDGAQSAGTSSPGKIILGTSDTGDTFPNNTVTINADQTVDFVSDIGVGAAAASGFALNVVKSNSAGKISRIQNTHASGFSDIDFYNNSGTVKGFVGWANASASPASELRFGTSSTDPVRVYINATDEVLSFSGSTGIPRFTNAIAYLTTQFDKTNTTFANITNWSTQPTLEAGKRYLIEVCLYLSSGNGGIKLDFNGGGATATTFKAQGYGLQTTVIFNNDNSPVTALGTTYAFSGSNATYGVRMDCYLVVNGAGTFIPRMAQQDADGGTTSVLVGSWIRYTQLD